MGKISGGQIMRLVLVMLILMSWILGQNYSGYAGSFVGNGSSARAIALGNALTAGSNLYYPAYYNPAGIANTTKKKILFAHQFLTFDRRQSTLGATLPLPPIGGFSLGWIGSGVTNIQGRNLTGDKTEVLSAAEDLFAISFGIMPFQKLQIGATLKILKNRLPNINGEITGSGVGFDLGILYSINNSLILATVVKNLNAGYQWSNEIDKNLNRTYQDKFPIQLFTGFEFQKYNFLLVSDIGIYFVENDYLDSALRVGIEYALAEDYFVRGGYFANHFAFGVGLELEQFNQIESNIDYAIVIERIGGLSHAISYAVNF